MKAVKMVPARPPNGVSTPSWLKIQPPTNAPTILPAPHATVGGSGTMGRRARQTCEERLEAYIDGLASVIGHADTQTGLLGRADLEGRLKASARALRLRELLQAIKATGRTPRRLAWATKGFEPGSGKLAHEVVAEELGKIPVCVLSGPTFALEVGKGLPTAITAAGDPEI